MSLRRYAVLGSADRSQDILDQYEGKYEGFFIDGASKEETLEKLKNGAVPEGTEVLVIQAESMLRLRLPLRENEFYTLFPKSLRLLIWSANGYDMFDTAFFRSRNLALANTPDAAQASTADTAMYLTLAAFRDFQQREQAVRQGKWKFGFPHPPGLEGKTLGLLGLGGIGKAHAIRAFAHGLKLAYYARHQVPDESLGILKDHIKYIPDLKEFLGSVDAVAVHVPLSSGTADLLNKETFSYFKPGSYLINTSRGGVVEEEALFEALENGPLAGAALDVFKNEPKIDERFRNHPKIAVLPHSGGDSEATSVLMQRQSLESVDEFFQTGTVSSVVPELRDLLEKK